MRWTWLLTAVLAGCADSVGTRNTPDGSSPDVSLASDASDVSLASDISDVSFASDASDADAASCPDGSLACATDGGAMVCVNSHSDRLNCGGCGVHCCSANNCIDGECIGEAWPGTTLCTVGPDRCHVPVDTQTDQSNCGECAHACAPGQFCVDALCVYPDAGH